jgi:hypothetical protein
MASADSCPITLHVAIRGAAKKQRPHVGQASPDKNVNCRYTTAAFTLSPESGALSCCAHSAGSGHPEQSRRVLTYPETGPCMPFLSVGSQLCTRASFRRNLTAPPLPSANVYVHVSRRRQDSHIGDLHPISSRPCRAYTRVLIQLI